MSTVKEGYVHAQYVLPSADFERLPYVIERQISDGMVGGDTELKKKTAVKGKVINI
jgi:hypothetical protein